MSVEVSPVRTRRELGEFIELPFRLYAGDPHWVAPLRSASRRELDPARNPFFCHARAEYFLARRGGRVVGRVAAIRNRAHEEKYEDGAGFWGWFEAEPDPEIVAALLDRAAKALFRMGRTEMRGPMSPSINGPCGLLVQGFDSPPSLRMPYNPPDYPSLVEAAGHARLLDLFAYDVRLEDLDPDYPRMKRLARIGAAVRRRRPGIVYRSLDMRRYEEETAALNRLFNEAREGNWGFVPVTDAEFAAMAREMKPFVLPDFVLLAEDGGEIVACLIALPDLNEILAPCRGRLLPFGWIRILRGRGKVRRLRLFGGATRKEYRNSGVTAALIERIVSNGRRRGILGGEVSWVAENNRKSLATIEKTFGLGPSKRYRIYVKTLGGPVA